MVENGDLDISDIDNNKKTNENNKSQCVNPDLDQQTLYSQGL